MDEALNLADYEANFIFGIVDENMKSVNLDPRIGIFKMKQLSDGGSN